MATLSFCIAIFIAITDYVVVGGNVIVEHPADVQVQIGQSANLTCVTDFQPYKCRWMIYRDHGLKQWSQVSEFTPVRANECSISISHVRHVHEGRWQCRAQPGWLRSYVRSRSASLVVIATPAADDGPQAPPPLVKFAQPRNISAIYGETVELECSLPGNRELERCGWLSPDGQFISLAREDSADSARASGVAGALFTGRLSNGDCQLQLAPLHQRHLGVWNCLLTSEDGGAIWTSPYYISSVERLTSSEADVSGVRAARSHASDDASVMAGGASVLTSVLLVSLTVIILIIMTAVIITVRRRRMQNSSTTDDASYVNSGDLQFGNGGQSKSAATLDNVHWVSHESSGDANKPYVKDHRPSGKLTDPATDGRRAVLNHYEAAPTASRTVSVDVDGRTSLASDMKAYSSGDSSENIYAEIADCKQQL